MNQLPDKPSELIRLALTDLEKCEKDPRYEVDMGSWHEPFKGKCLVCLAGSVIAQSIQIPVEKYVNPDLVDGGQKLRFLNDIRTEGHAIETAAYRDMVKPSDNFELPKYINYTDSPDAFKARLRYIADMYEKGGA